MNRTRRRKAKARRYGRKGITMFSLETRRMMRIEPRPIMLGEIGVMNGIHFFDEEEPYVPPNLTPITLAPPDIPAPTTKDPILKVFFESPAFKRTFGNE